MLHETKIKDYYNYFKITNVSCNEYATGYKTRGPRVSDNQYVDLDTNVEYSFSEYSNFWTLVKTTTNGENGYCDVTVKFYNK